MFIYVDGTADQDRGDIMFPSIRTYKYKINFDMRQYLGTTLRDHNIWYVSEDIRRGVWVLKLLAEFPHHLL
jgi:hypothetical protein